MLTTKELESLAKISTPTISNAVELYEVRPRNEGFLSPEIRCVFPSLGRMVGYAFTATIAADLPAGKGRALPRPEYWQAARTIPAPRVAVIQDVDNPAGKGSYWGEVNSNIHRSLGFVGTVTNGAVRDLDEMEALGFFAFAGNIAVSHAYVHLVDCGSPVRVGGVRVSPGDLLHGDRHGVLVVPAEVAPTIAETAMEVERAERELIGYCQTCDVDVPGLEKAYTRLQERFLEIAAKRRA